MAAELVQVRALSSGVTAIVHFAHAGLVIGGAVGVLALLSPMTLRKRRIAVAELREAAASGNLVRLAELRATRGQAGSESVVDRIPPALVFAVIGSMISAGVHVAVCPEHFGEGLRFGIFFVVASLCQTGWAVWVAWRPAGWLFIAGIAGNVTMIALWIITRSWGLPFGLDEVEPIGGLDSLATAGEVITVIACWACIGWGMRAGLVPSSGSRQLMKQRAS